MIRSLLLIPLLTVLVFAKPLSVVWDKIYGADKEEKAYDLTTTHDGGLAFCGITRSFSLGKEDIYVVKTDKNGQVIWERRLGKERKDIAYGIAEDSKGALYITGTTKSFSKEGDYNLFLIKLSPDGKTIWGKTLGGSSKDFGYALTVTKDDEVVVVGKTKSFGHGHYDVYVIKLDTKGNLLWSKAFGGSGNDEAHDITQLTDGSLIIAGATESFGNGDFDFYLLKLSPQGTKIWERYYGGKKLDLLTSVTSNQNGTFTTAGYTRSYHSQKKDLSVMRCDTKGNIVWHKLAGAHEHEIANDLVSDEQDGVVVVGSTKSKGHGRDDFYILRFNKKGENTYTNTFGGKKNEVAHAIVRTADGGFVIAGESESFKESDDYDAYLMKLK